MSNRIGTRALAAIFAVTTGALVLIAAPAQALPKDKSDLDCWLNADTGVVQCFADEEALQDAVVEQTGAPLITEGTAARLPAGALSTFLIAQFYDGTSYTGASYTVSSGSSTICTAGSGLSGNFPAAWNDRVSSYHTYFSCATRIFVNTGGGGSWYGYAVNAPSVAGLDNLASSYSIV